MPIDINDVRNLEGREGWLDFQAMLKERSANGFQHFIADIAIGETKSGSGWELKAPPFPGFTTGYLVVQAVHDTNELMDYLESRMSHYDWFETRAQLEDKKRAYRAANNGAELILEAPVLPEGYDVYPYRFKSLGYWGSNPAMDVGTFVKDEDGAFWAQVIIRPDKKMAFVGGMVDKNYAQQSAEIIKKCQQEFIEEFYSNDLFAKNSATMREASKMPPSQLSSVLDAVLKEPEFAKLAKIAANFMPIFTQLGLSINDRIAELEKQLKQQGKIELQRLLREQGKTNIVPDADLDVMWVRMKCKLYQHMFPAQYRNLCEFLEQNLVVMPSTTNESDGRNTQLAFMITTPHYFLIMMDALKRLQQQWLVAPKGGDDAISAKLVRLEDLFTKGMFSAHGRIKLSMLAHILENNPSELHNQALERQIVEIKRRIERRELEQLGQVSINRSGVATQLRTPQPQIGAASASVQSGQVQNQLATVTGPVSLQQLNNNLSSVNAEQLEMVDSTEDAINRLKARLSRTRYERMCEILENDLRLPMSALVTLSRLADHKKVNILLDNSGSMGDPYQGATRWQEAYARLKTLLPLLALSGVKVELRLLNDPRVHSLDVVKNFDFSKDIAMENVAALEAELKVAFAHLARIFAASPTGGTVIEKPLREICSQNTTQDEHLLLFITDGEPTDQAEALRALKSGITTKNPVMVVACTDKDIVWVRNVSKEGGVRIAMLDDYFKEKQRLEVYHGTAVPYSRETWLLLHLTPAARTLPEAVGLQLYHAAAKTEDAFDKNQLAQILGYDPGERGYEFYLAARQQYLSTLRHGVVDAVAVGQPMLAAYSQGQQSQAGFPPAPVSHQSNQSSAPANVWRPWY